MHSKFKDVTKSPYHKTQERKRENRMIETTTTKASATKKHPNNRDNYDFMITHNGHNWSGDVQ